MSISRAPALGRSVASSALLLCSFAASGSGRLRFPGFGSDLVIFTPVSIRWTHATNPVGRGPVSSPRRPRWSQTARPSPFAASQYAGRISGITLQPTDRGSMCSSAILTFSALSGWMQRKSGGILQHGPSGHHRSGGSPGIPEWKFVCRRPHPADRIPSAAD